MMKINVEAIISAIQNSFENETSYRKECLKKPWYNRSQSERDNVLWHERNAQGSFYELRDLRDIFDFDFNRMYAMARFARKWEQKHNWERCFPANENATRILDYMAKPTTGYIHDSINSRAERVASGKPAYWFGLKKTA